MNKKQLYMIQFRKVWEQLLDDKQIPDADIKLLDQLTREAIDEAQNPDTDSKRVAEMS